MEIPWNKIWFVVGAGWIIFCGAVILTELTFKENLKKYFKWIIVIAIIGYLFNLIYIYSIICL